MEALVNAFAWNLESGKVLTRENGLAARRVNGSEDGNVVDSDADFGLMFPQEFLNEDDLFSPSLLWRVVGHGIHLPYKVVPGDVANDGNAMLAFLPVQKREIGGGEGNE